MTNATFSNTAPPAEFTLIIPCYNEAERLRPDEYARFLEANPQVRVRFVDDGSGDSTCAVLERLCARFPNAAHFGALPQNAGKAEAVRAGMLCFAKDESAGEYVGFWDSDLATPLEESLRFADVLKRHGRFRCVIGSRRPHLGARIKRDRMRRIVSLAVMSVIRLYLGFPVYDSQCGAKMFRRPEAEKLFAAPFVSRWLFDVELFKRMKLEHAKTNPAEYVCEIPLLEWRDVAGTKLKFRHGFAILRELARIARKYGRK